MNRFNKKKFFKYMFDNFKHISWRGEIVSIDDLLERIITVQDFLALKSVFYNYKDRFELYDSLYYKMSNISHFNEEYELRYKKVVNTFNYLRFR